MASGGLAGAAIVILTWVLSLFHVTLPADVAAALIVMLSAAVHAGVLKWAIDPLTPAQAAADVITGPVAAAPAVVAPAVVAPAVVAPAPGPQVVVPVQ
jgi:hypothetical protein